MIQNKTETDDGLEEGQTMDKQEIEFNARNHTVEDADTDFVAIAHDQINNNAYNRTLVTDGEKWGYAKIADNQWTVFDVGTIEVEDVEMVAEGSEDWEEWFEHEPEAVEDFIDNLVGNGLRLHKVGRGAIQVHPSTGGLAAIHYQIE
ncbi:hypothetical protein [Natronolimnobius baerhuensis]|uniref:hypothetical protein n=1 Tax=Natronolimnobius baerhuensis TaxID=253108 RepID=UPI001124D1C2|nr:hypothetical protein [Natronolimnobius baerhuensis]